MTREKLNRMCRGYQQVLLTRWDVRGTPHAFTTKYIDMEFSEIGKELGGLTADQVYEMAKFGKGILDHAGGMVCLQSGLLGMVKDVLKADDFDLNENRLAIEALLHIVYMVEDLIEKCWSERKTPLGLLGLQTENDFFGLKEATIIQML